jgi:hypothetical protein
MKSPDHEEGSGRGRVILETLKISKQESNPEP